MSERQTSNFETPSRGGSFDPRLSGQSHLPIDGIEEAPSSIESKESCQEGTAGALEIENFQEKFFANTLLTVSSGKVSAGLDSFASWLFGGSAAALTFLLGNLESLGKYVYVSALRDSAYILLGAAIPVVAEKLISAMVVGAAEGDASAREIGEATANRGVELDLPLALREFEQAFSPPFRWFIRRSIGKMKKGDLAASGRRLTKLTQIQVGLVITEVILIIWAVSTLLGGFAI